MLLTNNKVTDDGSSAQSLQEGQAMVDSLTKVGYKQLAVSKFTAQVMLHAFISFACIVHRVIICTGRYETVTQTGTIGLIDACEIFSNKPEKQVNFQISFLLFFFVFICFCVKLTCWHKRILKQHMACSLRRKKHFICIIMFYASVHNCFTVS